MIGTTATAPTSVRALATDAAHRPAVLSVPGDRARTVPVVEPDDSELVERVQGELAAAHPPRSSSGGASSPRAAS